MGSPQIALDRSGYPILVQGMGDTFSTDPNDFGVPPVTGVVRTDPTGADVEVALAAIAKQSCADSNGIWNSADGSCTGSGGSSTCPAGYTLSGFSCIPAGASPSTCPAGSTCSIIPGIPNSSIYLGIAAVVSMFFLASAFGGRR